MITVMMRKDSVLSTKMLFVEGQLEYHCQRIRNISNFHQDSEHFSLGQASHITPKLESFAVEGLIIHLLDNVTMIIDIKDYLSQGCSAEARVRRSLEKLNIPSWYILSLDNLS